MIVAGVSTLFLFLILRKCFQFFTMFENVCCGFVIYGLYYVEVGSLYAHFMESSFFFPHKWVLNFVKCFFCIYWYYHIFFIFQFVNIVYHIGQFAYTKEYLHPWDKPHLTMVYDSLDVLLDSVLVFCWGFLHLCWSVILTCDCFSLSNFGEEF